MTLDQAHAITALYQSQNIRAFRQAIRNMSLAEGLDLIELAGVPRHYIINAMRNALE